MCISCSFLAGACTDRVSFEKLEDGVPPLLPCAGEPLADDDDDDGNKCVAAPMEGAIVVVVVVTNEFFGGLPGG